MERAKIWQQSVDLTNRILQLCSGLDLPRGDHWPTLVTVSLNQADLRLHSITMLLNNERNDDDDWDSAVILTRSLFELEVNLSYIAKDIDNRLPEYLRHGGVPLLEEEMEQAKAEVEGGQTDLWDFVPKQAWKSLWEMCSDLGGRLREYETFYRYASVPTHAGAFTLGKSFVKLLNRQPLTDPERAVVLVTGAEFHLRVASIAAKTFPEHIAIERVEELREECSNLGRALPSSM